MVWGGSYFVRYSSVRLYVYKGLLNFQAENLVCTHYHLYVYVCLFVCVCMFESVVYMMYGMYGGCTHLCVILKPWGGYHVSFFILFFILCP